MVVMVVGAVRCSSSCPVQAGEGVGAELEVSQVEERRGGVSSAGTGAEARAGSGTRTGPEYRKQRRVCRGGVAKSENVSGPCKSPSYLGLGPALNFLVLPGVLVVLVLGALVWSPSRSCSDHSS